MSDAEAALLAALTQTADPARRLELLAEHYADPAVRAALGYPGPVAAPLPELPDARDAELAPLLARVRARGPAYRDTSPS
jgi:hypothetical protein